MKVKEVKELLVISEKKFPKLEKLIQGKADDAELDIIDRNDYIAAKLWSREDAEDEFASLICESCPCEFLPYTPAIQNSERIINEAQKNGSFQILSDCTEEDWGNLNYALDYTVRSFFKDKKIEGIIQVVDAVNETIIDSVSCHINTITHEVSLDNLFHIFPNCQDKDITCKVISSSQEYLGDMFPSDINPDDLVHLANDLDQTQVFWMVSSYFPSKQRTFGWLEKYVPCKECPIRSYCKMNKGDHAICRIVELADTSIDQLKEMAEKTSFERFVLKENSKGIKETFYDCIIDYIRKEHSIKYFTAFYESLCKNLPSSAEEDIWSDGSMILCKDEKTAETIANVLELMYKKEEIDVVIVTGYYNPIDDARNDEVDMYTGWYYVSME